MFIKDMFFKDLKFTGDLFENDQKGELYILNNETKKYDKIYVGELCYYEIIWKYNRRQFLRVEVVIWENTLEQMELEE